jgi:hypothetical protein
MKTKNKALDRKLTAFVVGVMNLKAEYGHPDHFTDEQQALEWFRRAAHIALECGLLLDAPSHVVWLALQDGLNGHFESYNPGSETVAALRTAEAHTALAAEAARLRLGAA